jgi:outer membrane lipoprotein carrier protein
MRFRPYIIPLLLLCGAASVCVAADRDTEDALERLKSLTASVDTLRCDFTQTTNIPLFANPVESRGKLLFKKPDSLVWEYTSPTAQGLVFSGGKGFRWEEEKNRRVPFTTAEDPVASLVAAQMLAWIRFDRSWMEARYAVHSGGKDGLSFLLIPKNADLRSILASLSIRFADDGVARTILLKEASGGSTTIQLHNVAVNGPSDAGEFR